VALQLPKILMKRLLSFVIALSHKIDDDDFFRL